MPEERIEPQSDSRETPPVTAWVPQPVNVTAHIPLWELRPWYALVVTRETLRGDTKDG